MEMINVIQKKFGNVKVASGAMQGEITAAVIRSISDIKKEQGAAEALKIAQIFSKAISLYEQGVPIATALLAVAELQKDKKSAGKILGFAFISLATALPYVLINQEKFEEFVEDLRSDAKNTSGRKSSKLAKVTRLKPRKKS
jgi:hypothetical protein